MDTLVLVILARGFKVGRDAISVRVGDAAVEDVLDHLRQVAQDEAVDVLALAHLAQDPTREKYDHLLPDDLLAEDFAARRLDGVGAMNAVREILKGQMPDSEPPRRPAVDAAP